MWIVFGSRSDTTALWIAEGLRERGLKPVIWIPAEILPLAHRWVHRIGQSGASLALTLADGRRLRSSKVKGVVNRMPWAPDHSLLVAPEDREYVRQEMSAFYLSWLYSLPVPILNRPHPQGLAGAFRPPAVWHFLAARAGLETIPYRARSRDLSPAVQQTAASQAPMLFIVGKEAVPVPGHPVPPKRVQEAAVRLGKLSHTSLLALHFEIGGWHFSGADSFPNLTLGGPPLLDALVRCLTLSGETRP